MATASAPTHEHHHAPAHYTTTGLPHNKIAMWAFIGSECLLFASLISTYLVYKGRSIVGPYPHEYWCRATGVIQNTPIANCPPAELFNPILNIPVTSASTFVLLMSSLAMVLAHAAVERSDQKYSKIWLAVTALLGATFLGFQAYEFTSFVHEGLTIRTNLFGSTFFTLTGFHGAHVTAGVMWLTTLLFIDFKRGLEPRDAINVDLCALYWHFVDVVWIAIFTLVYLIQ
ncbi:MAG TPA: cytochrome c oxidase subunit 3 [Gemmatimonadaceae bacterium]|nr:cytochrome c oxidase subunit 3 [Gemmatimonadaceae bacterium]